MMSVCSVYSLVLLIRSERYTVRLTNTPKHLSSKLYMRVEELERTYLLKPHVTCAGVGE